MKISKDINLSLSWCGYENLLEYIHSKSSLSIGTLGPSGTSSEYALGYFKNQFILSHASVQTQLFSTFEELKTAVCHKQVQLAVVPHAYQEINHFYMNPDIDLLFIFICPTPTYGLAKRKETSISLDRGKLATHPAPLPLLPYLLGTNCEHKFDIEIVSSTSVAAHMVHEGLVDLAITNEKAANDYGLDLIKTYGPLPMSWSIFRQKR